jgi:threonine aldolase
VLVQADSHLFNDSGDCAEVLSGLNLVPLGEGRATLTLDEIEAWVERSATGRVENRVGVIVIEDPVRRHGHEFVDPAELARISRFARDHGIRLHLDGARMFNLPQHTGRSVVEHAALFDTVYVSLWKHFNAATGAILAGSREHLEGLFHERRRFGGALPAAWPSLAPVPRFLPTYEADYARAWTIADALFRRL